ncbi:MAG: DASS family sodium-coupled anion symporter [Candidatus Latescibacteria bacterium]|nr:DASS family sodium-coupled anion symporter [Candidatus Latescibacterota bacterium]
MAPESEAATSAVSASRTWVATGTGLVLDVPAHRFQDGRVSTKQRIGLVLSPALALALLLFGDLDPGDPAVTRMAAVAVLMAGWWITEAIPIPATALLPVALFPILGIMRGRDVAGVYFNHVIFLFIGGFLLALAMQKWDLHRRIALRIILLLGTGRKRLMLGFMVATWFLSMWISNTATTMMMVPMALAITIQLKRSLDGRLSGRYATGLLIGVAYAASIGGIATLIGTPPNLSFVRILKIVFPAAPEISFASWFFFAFPLSLVFLMIAWAVLVRMFAPRGAAPAERSDLIREEHRKLGPLRYEEGMILGLFSLLVLLWMFRSDIAIGTFTIPGWTRIMPVPEAIDDGTVAIAVALLLFILPSRTEPKQRLLDWRTARELQWGIVLLFGGGFALASGFKESGLSEWLGGRLTGLGGLPPIAIILTVCGGLTFLTELTSNTATTEMILPVLGSLGVATGINPLLLMVPATLSASCAFMLPVATPPNAIVFGSGEVRIADMVRSGIVLNLIGIGLIALSVTLLGTWILGIDPNTVPDWASIR